MMAEYYLATFQFQTFSEMHLFAESYITGYTTFSQQAISLALRL